VKDLSFEEALAESEQLLARLDASDLAGGAARQEIGSIIGTVSGARGFLVTLLTGEFRSSDQPGEALLEELSSAASVVCDLLAKNLVMSTAMALTHERNGHSEMADGSRRVFTRTTKLVTMLDGEEMSKRIEQMWLSVTQSRGEYVSFLQRWKYDDEQLEKVAAALSPLRKG
jgi:hypothetical protein